VEPAHGQAELEAGFRPRRSRNWLPRQKLAGRGAYREGGEGSNGLVKGARFLRILIAAAIAVAALYYFRGRPREAGTDTSQASRRGGQIVASARSEPRSFNRLLARDVTTEIVSTLLQGRLLRINRSTFEPEPWLAERWESSADGLTHTFHLRQNVVWSDGAPFTSADVIFSLEAALDPKVKSVVADSMTVGGQPIKASAPDAGTVVFTFARPFGPGVRIFDYLPILPKHKLGAALAAGTLTKAWGPATPPAELVGLGPFVLREYVAGQRLVFDRNPHYWRKTESGEQLPFLDRLVLEIVPEQNAELLRLTSGETDLTHSELRADDYVPVRRAEEAGKVKLLELGVATDADAFWFCLKPEVKGKDPRFRFLQKREFRQALSHAVDREELARTVFAGAAVPIWGPVTPGNQPWFSPNVPRYPHSVEKARELLKSIGLEDRNGNGIVEDEKGTEARFTVITQKGITNYEGGTTLLREDAKKVGIQLDIAPLEVGALIDRIGPCNYDAIYFRPVMTDLDPALNLDFWLSSGETHFWNASQKTPATEWEKEIDRLMTEQASTPNVERRKALFNEVQKIFAENVPVLYFAAPRLFYGHSARLQGVVPSVTRPPVLWNADMLSVGEAGAGPSR
jgi:peptide/nickel transport system substrate-binding protein